jgi:hypothetical protein
MDQRSVPRWFYLNLRAIQLAIDRDPNPFTASDYFARKLTRQFKNLEAYSPMARKPNKSNQTQNDYNAPKFVHLKLSKGEKNEFDTWAAALKNGGFDAVTDFTQEGYKTSFTLDKDGKSYIASTTAPDDTNPNHGYCLTSRASSWLEAVLINIYKTDVYCNDGIWADGEDEDNWG